MGHLFLDLPNVIGSPHNSAGGGAWRDEYLRRAVQNCRRAILGETPWNLIGSDERMHVMRQKLMEGRQAAAKCAVHQIGARQDVVECLAQLNTVSRISASAPRNKLSIAGPEPIIPVAAYIDSRPSFTSSAMRV